GEAARRDRLELDRAVTGLVRVRGAGEGEAGAGVGGAHRYASVAIPGRVVHCPQPVQLLDRGGADRARAHLPRAESGDGDLDEAEGARRGAAGVVAGVAGAGSGRLVDARREGDERDRDDPLEPVPEPPGARSYLPFHAASPLHWSMLRREALWDGGHGVIVISVSP